MFSPEVAHQKSERERAILTVLKTIVEKAPILAIPLLLFLMMSSVHAQDVPDLHDVLHEPTVIGGRDVSEKDYNPAIGIIVGSLDHIKQTFKGGATVIDATHILGAAHVMGDIKYGSIYFLPCRDIDNCDPKQAIEITEAMLFDPIDTDWYKGEAEDVAVGTLAHSTDIVPVTLGGADTALSDPIFIRGHGCTDEAETIFPTIQKEAGLSDIEVDRNETLFHDDKQRGCSGDSGTFGGIKRNGSYIQTGVFVRGGSGLSVLETVSKYRTRIEACVSNTNCNEHRYTPPDQEIVLGDVVTDDVYLLPPRATSLTIPAPGVLANDKDRVTIYSGGSTTEDPASIRIFFPTGAFTFELNGSKYSSHQFYYYGCDTNHICETGSITVAHAKTQLFLPIFTGTE